MKLDLEDINVHYVEITHEVARAFFDDQQLGEDFELALDKAQGEVQERGPQYVVIKII